MHKENSRKYEVMSSQEKFILPNSYISNCARSQKYFEIWIPGRLHENMWNKLLLLLFLLLLLARAPSSVPSVSMGIFSATKYNTNIGHHINSYDSLLKQEAHGPWHSADITTYLKKSSYYASLVQKFEVLPWLRLLLTKIQMVAMPLFTRKFNFDP